MIRSWRRNDEARLAAAANDRSVSRYMPDAFPHPYTTEDARAWINLNRNSKVATNFAVTVEDTVVGGIGYRRLSLEKRFTAEWGYWLGSRYWGQGLATCAATEFVAYVFENYEIERLQAHVYAPNVASMRVLENSGHVREGVLRRAVYKSGRFYDVALYALTRDMR
ncbi:MAG: GNAT family N-acetyltransferase [Candidatus Eremiobacteraeota bacterium]|nr:GNAT family N-acetyltransferase [Candidatus Eremiobacteraeota bacterium]